MGCCGSTVIENVVIEGPTDDFAKYGAPVEHILINKPVQNKYKVTLSTRTHYTSNTSNIYPELAEQYNLGYRFLELLPFPYQINISGFATTWQVYQAIFYKDPTEEPGNDWQFHVEQSQYTTEGIFERSRLNKMTTTYSMDGLFEKLTQMTSNGARYLGLTQTGQDRTFTGAQNHKMNSVISVDLLFEIPRGPPRETYVYRTLSQPVETENLPNGPVKCEFDYSTVVENHLSEGWRLITAFMDAGAYNLGNAKQKGVSKTNLECLYVFEKPSSILHVNRRRYEIAVIPFPYKLASSLAPSGMPQ